MQNDHRAAVLKIAKFLDVNVPEETIAEVYRKSSFGYMKQIDERFAPESIVPWGRKVTMMRKGVQGGSSGITNSGSAARHRCPLHRGAETDRVGFPVRRVLRTGLDIIDCSIPHKN